MKCSKCKEYQLGFLQEKLSPAQSADVQNHLLECESCEGDFSLSKELWVSLDQESEKMPSPHLRQRFESMLAHEITKNTFNESSHRKQSFFSFLWPTRPTWAASYSLALILGGTFMGQALPQSNLLLGLINIPAQQFDYDNIPQERLIQICAVDNSQYLQTL